MSQGLCEDAATIHYKLDAAVMKTDVISFNSSSLFISPGRELIVHIKSCGRHRGLKTDEMFGLEAYSEFHGKVYYNAILLLYKNSLYMI